jgi:hypothetical protein
MIRKKPAPHLDSGVGASFPSRQRGSCSRGNDAKSFVKYPEVFDRQQKSRELLQFDLPEIGAAAPIFLQIQVGDFPDKSLQFTISASKIVKQAPNEWRSIAIDRSTVGTVELIRGSIRGMTQINGRIADLGGEAFVSLPADLAKLMSKKPRHGPRSYEQPTSGRNETG